MSTKDEKNAVRDTELESVTGGGEFIGFVDSDDYEHSETYEEAYKYEKKDAFAGREISPLN